MTPEEIRQKLQQVKKQRLTELDLSNPSWIPEWEKLTQIPTEVFEWEWLETLNLSWNKLTTVPEAITCLTNLSELNLSENPLEDPPSEISEEGIDAIREYFRHKQAGEDKPI